MPNCFSTHGPRGHKGIRGGQKQREREEEGRGDRNSKRVKSHAWTKGDRETLRGRNRGKTEGPAEGEMSGGRSDRLQV